MTDAAAARQLHEARRRDVELVRAALADDRAAFREIYDRYAPSLYGLCVRKAGNEAAGRDLMQDVFVNAYRNLDKLRAPERLREWLFSIAFNAARSQAAGERRWQRTREAYAPERICEDPADRDEPLLRELRIEAVREAIARTQDEKQRQLLVRYYMDDRAPTTRELADELGMPPSTVTVTLMRARAAVTRQILATLASLGEVPA